MLVSQRTAPLSSYADRLCEELSDEAFQSAPGILDCFATLARTSLMLGTLLMLGGCNFFDKPPSADDIYGAVSGMKEQPFNIEAVSCKPAGSGAFECAFSATVVTGYVPAYGGEMRPEYKVVDMRGLFRKTGQRWARLDTP